MAEQSTLHQRDRGETGETSLTASGIDLAREVAELNARAWDLRKTDTRVASELCDRARELALQAADTTGLAYAHRNSGVIHWLLADGKLAEKELLVALDLFRACADESGEASALNWLGNVSWRQGNYQKALSYHCESLEIRRRIGDGKGEADSLNNLGLTYFDLADYAKSLEYQYDSLKLSEANESRDGIASSLNNIAIVYEKRGEYDKALEYNLRSLEIKQEIGDKLYMPGSLTNIGMIYSHLGDYANALAYHEQSLDIAREIEHKHAAAVSFGNIGNVRLLLKEHETAIECFRHAAQLMNEIGDRYYEADALLGLGKAYLATVQTDQALETLQLARTIAVETESNELLYLAHERLSAAYEQMHDFTSALEHHKEFFRLRELVLDEESKRRIGQLMVQAEVERAHREAEIHRLKHVELAHAYDDLRRADNLKGELLRKVQQQAELLDRQAREDSLTGLYNRRYLDQRLRQEFERCQRFQHPLAVVMVDIDLFKDINDRFMHQTGDEVIKAVAKIMRGTCRSIDVVGRYGGEEFVVILVETTLASAAGFCEELRARVQNHEWSAIQPGLGVTISLGIAELGRLQSVDQVLTAADAKMYEAKRAGRNKTCY